MPTVLILPELLRNQPGPFRSILEAEGFDVIDASGASTLTDAQLRPFMAGVDAIIAGSERFTAEVMDLAPGLRAIARTGVGYDAVDVDAATARKIAVAIVPGTNHESVAEHAFALLLALARRTAEQDRAIRRGIYDRTQPTHLRGKTIGLIGMGRIGRAVATRARAFGMRVVAYDLMADPEFDAEHGIARHAFEELLGVADVVSLHLPLTETTRHLFDRQLFAMMKPGSYFINTARGGLMVEADLREALVSGHLAGAGLDVFNPEPPRPDNPLLRLENVISTPHVAGIDAKGMADMAEMAAQTVATLRRGGWPAEGVVNPELRAAWRW